ncbi:hypothetical protein AT15_06100 [Kosmotoga arenicorallina S304]|uniref:Uncharacterized protein n=1 Tax=Kosmotoga arenicorallina S304 TaxID=1453497 RepID=A0A182C7L8_9BACT|nr:hypothetical protein [Kosmotoga arenicorallina]OAA31643.1 hypothetical protein AT15_06100 [Kosmotoga arenicorallina S304]
MEDQISFMKQFREISHEYREKLSEAKTPADVGDIFITFIHKMLVNVGIEVSNKAIEYIVFDPESEEIVKFEKPLYEKLTEIFKKSDLENIIQKMALTAKHRHMQITHDTDRTDMYRRHD